MKTIAVPVDFLNQVIVRLNDMAKGYVAAAGVTRSNISALADQARLYAAAPPQSELVALDSRKREIVANAEALVPFLEAGWDEQDEPDDQAQANTACDRLIAAVKGTTNAAAPQENAGSPNAGSDPAPAAALITNAEAFAMDCESYTVPAAAPRFEDAIQGRPLSTIVADENNAAPGRKGQSLEASSNEGRAESAPAAAPFTVPACAELSVTPAIYAADYTMRHAPSTLPLSAEEINAMKGLLGANTLCDQALRAIELEQRVNELKGQPVPLSEWQKMEQQLAEKDREIARLNQILNLTIEGAGNQMVRAEHAEDKLEKAEAELAELKAG